MSFPLFWLASIVYMLSAAAYLVFFLSKRDAVRKQARLLLFAGAILHTLNIFFRFFEAGYTPLASLHETMSFFAWAIAWAYLAFRWRYTVRNFGTFVSLLVVACMICAALFPHEYIQLSPELQSWWLPVHASVALLAYAFLALSGVGSAMYLLQERELKQKRFGVFYSRMPSLESLDKLNHHCLRVGFPLLTLGLITGSLWSHHIKGSYWQWSPKEAWSLIAWLLYAGVMHQRFTVGWRGRQAAWVSLVALLSAIFALWGVSLLFQRGGI